MHVRVLVFREQGIVALDPTTFHVLVPTCLDVGFDQGSLTLSRSVEFDLLDLILKVNLVTSCAIQTKLFGAYANG